MDKKDMREKNLELTLSVLRRLKQASKPALSKETGLSVVTINAIMETLVSRGEAELVENTVSIGGRPARQYSLNAKKRLILGAYITREATNFTLTTFVIDLFGEVISGDEIQTDDIAVEFLENEFNKIISNYKEIKKILLGLDGTTYNKFNNKNLETELENRVNRSVVLARDIHAATIGGMKLEGVDTADKTLIGVSWTPDTLEMGILLDGKIYKGRDGFAGSLGEEYNTANAVEDAGNALKLLTRTFNPHEVIFYNEKLRSNNTEQIINIAKQGIEEFLPNVLIRPDIREDYGEGMYTLASVYLTGDIE